MCCRSIIALWALAISLAPSLIFGRQVEDDPISNITKALPIGWKVRLTTHNRDCIIRIETNRLETVPSHYSNDDGDKKEAVWIELQVLPKYSAAMLKRIEDYNQPFIDRLKLTADDPAQRDSIKAKMIPFPMYQDGGYSYVVLPPGRVPRNDKDFEVLRGVLQKITSDWVAIDKRVTPVKDIPTVYRDK